METYYQYLIDEDNLEWTSNRTVYNRRLKYRREDKGLIHCAFCKYHKGENQFYYSERNWKSCRKTQYKEV